MDKFYGIVVGLFIIFLVLVVPLRAWTTYDTVYNVTVTEKTVKRNGDTDKYLIFTEDANGNREVFQNTDAWLNLKVNSSDIWAEIGEGDTCTFAVNGWRFRLMSWYRNILEVQECG